MADHELGARPLPKAGKHPAIFRAYDALGVGESLLLVNDHDPRHLRDEFEVEHPCRPARRSALTLATAPAGRP